MRLLLAWQNLWMAARDHIHAWGTPVTGIAWAMHSERLLAMELEVFGWSWHQDLKFMAPPSEARVYRILLACVECALGVPHHLKAVGVLVGPEGGLWVDHHWRWEAA